MTGTPFRLAWERTTSEPVRRWKCGHCQKTFPLDPQCWPLACPLCGVGAGTAGWEARKIQHGCYGHPCGECDR